MADRALPLDTTGAHTVEIEKEFQLALATILLGSRHIAKPTANNKVAKRYVIAIPRFDRGTSGL